MDKKAEDRFVVKKGDIKIIKKPVITQVKKNNNNDAGGKK